jgi:hypothetical protein
MFARILTSVFANYDNDVRVADSSHGWMIAWLHVCSGDDLITGDSTTWLGGCLAGWWFPTKPLPRSEMHISFHVKGPLLLCSFNQNRNIWANFSKTLQYQIEWKSEEYGCLLGGWRHAVRKIVRTWNLTSWKSVQRLEFLHIHTDRQTWSIFATFSCEHTYTS